MTLEKQKQIRTKLLEKLSLNGKLYLIKDIDSIAKECNVSKKEVIQTIQKAYLTSFSNFKYDLTETRNSVKILALDNPNYNINLVEYMCGSCDGINAAKARYILSQFSPQLDIEDIKKIYEFYIDITTPINSDLEILYLAIDRDSDSNNIYIKTRFDVREVNHILGLITKYGYSYEKDKVLYWKAYSPNVEIDDEDLINQFSILARKEKEKEETFNQETNNYKCKCNDKANFVLDTRTALNHIAKELGICLTEKESEQRLDEVIATTNELISNFDNLPDWEKLKSWDKFVSDWKAIMGDAINDRN